MQSYVCLPLALSLTELAVRLQFVQQSSSKLIITRFLSPFFHIRVALCQGKFPNFLIDAWDEYDFRKDSDNDRPGKIRYQSLMILGGHFL